MKKLKSLAVRLWRDESGQGATEYILLLMVVVGLAIIFREKIAEAVKGKLGELEGMLGGFSGPQ